MLDIIRQAFINLFSAKLRSFLATLGILVGTASVVALVSSGQLATEKALEEFKALGTEILAVSLFEANASSSIAPGITLDYDEAMAMESEIPDVLKVAPYTTVFVPIIYDGKLIEGNIVGATDRLKYSININTEKGGGFISFLDSYEHFCVIGHDIYEKIMEQTKKNPLGKQIWLGSIIYTIIGVAKPWPENSFFNANVNTSVFVPLKGSALLSPNTKIRNLILILSKDADIDFVQNKINEYIAKKAPGLKTFFRSAKQLISSMRNQQAIFTLLLGMIGGVSLLVGGIGVMNIMLVSVVERRREIGIRKAIGAKQRDIQHLFLSESVILSLFGGMLGVIIGILVSYIISIIAKWGFQFLILPPLIGFTVSAATGIFFGFYPAYRASRLDPIEALRYE